MSLVNANTAIFDSNDLTSVSGLTVLASNPYMPAARNVKVGEVARSDKSNVNAAFYNSRNITLRIGIVGATRDLLEASFDSLMTLLQGLEKALILKQAGATRQYTATFSDCVIHTEGGSYLEFDLVFVTSDHFGYDVAATTLLQFSGFTSSYRSDQLSFGGSAPFQVPTITLTFTSITSGTNKAVTISNASNGQSVVISRIWVTGDVLEINSNAKTVKINGSEVAFTGAIPEFSQGVGYWVYSDTFTARTFNGLLQYNKRYV